jgi:hypothetical protein
MTMTRGLRLIAIAVAAIAVAATANVAAAAQGGSGGVTGPAFYVDGVLYRTVATPTDLSNTGAPDHSFDTVYDFGGLQTNVATAAPGDRDYNGGRWRVHALAFSDYLGAVADSSVDMNSNGVLDSDAEVQAAIAEGYASDAGIVKSFECPVIPLPKGHA